MVEKTAIKAAVILAGCGYLDGAEIREAVITLMALDQEDVAVQCFAPDINQMHVMNHLTGEVTNETRNVLVESARIARGEVKPLSEAKAADFDVLLLPGGFGAAKNLSDIAVKGAQGDVLPEYAALVKAFHAAEKPIGAICISPAVLVAALRGQASPIVTIGDDADGLIAGLGGQHQECQTKGIVIDEANHIVSCSAYMREDRLTNVRAGIEKLVLATLEMARQSRN